jgi:chromosome segregation ATPase
VNEKCDELNRKLETASKELEDKESEIATLKQNLEEAINSFSTKEVEYENKISDLSQEICSKGEKIFNLESELQASFEKLKAEQKLLDDMTAEFNDKLAARDRTIEVFNQVCLRALRFLSSKWLAFITSSKFSEIRRPTS